MQRKASFAEGEYYHVYNRGVEKRDIFLDKSDYARFQKMLFACNGTKSIVFKEIQGLPLEQINRGEPIVAIGAYVLMPNHFHVLVREIREGGISSFMEKISTGYSMYFNKKYERVGALFQGTFKAEHIVDDVHLKYLFAYIHLNPIKLIYPLWKDQGVSDRKSAQDFLHTYGWSSYADYADNMPARNHHLILSPSVFPEYFQNRTDFSQYLSEWLNFKRTSSPQGLPLGELCGMKVIG